LGRFKGNLKSTEAQHNDPDRIAKRITPRKPPAGPRFGKEILRHRLRRPPLCPRAAQGCDEAFRLDGENVDLHARCEGSAACRAKAAG
jgi:hypothetical protein